MKVGISVLTHAGQSIWENGIGQNVIYLAQLLSSIDFVEEVVLLNCGDQSALPFDVNLEKLNLCLMTPRDATHIIDIVIEMAGGLDVEWLDYMRALGKRVVFHCCRQAYTSLVEPVIFEKPGYFARTDRCDEVWVHPGDLRFKSMLEVVHRCPVIDVPYIWDSNFLQNRADELARSGIQFGYQPRSHVTKEKRSMRIAIFEPNISVTKVCVVPMLICDAAFRIDSESLSAVHVLNSMQMKDHPTFGHLARSLDIVKNNLATFEKRHDFAGYMSQFADVVISHQWLNGMNTLYLDALYGGYPLIHNSPWLGANVGYYYEESHISVGARHLLDVASNHDANYDSYRQRSHAFLESLSPFDRQNQGRYARSLLNLRSLVSPKGLQ